MAAMNLTQAMLALAFCLVSTAGAQRVQLPASGPDAFGAGPAAPGTTLGGATLGNPAVMNPPGAAPAFDPYLSSPFGPPPPNVPYTYSQPVAPFQPTPQGVAPQAYGAQPSYVQPQGAGYPTEWPLGWESGTYGYEQADGSVVRFQQFFQKLDGEYTHLFGDTSDPTDLRLNRIEISSTFAWPLGGNIDSPLLLTPGFVYNDFDFAPLSAAFPNQVYEAYLDAAWFPVFNEVFSGELGFRTGVWTDFNQVNSDSVRLLGRALGVVRVTPATEVLFGVVYLDRRRIKLLPAGGVRWRPTPDLEVSAVFPNPMIRHRLPTVGATGWWIYLAGEYGGGSWTHEGAPGGVDYNDLRVSLGFEFETESQVSGRFEVGYVFDREFYIPGPGGPTVVEFDQTVMLRAGINL